MSASAAAVRMSSVQDTQLCSVAGAERPYDARMARPGGVAQELSRAGVTTREAEVLALVATRLTNGEIAARLHLSVRTVESHMSALLRKLGTSSRADLVRLGAQLRRPPRGLPEPLTSFVGRTREIDAIAGLLARAPLVTLIGPGGVGKTRLALGAAAALADAYADGVRLVDFAPLVSGGLVTEAVARALGVREQPDQPLAAVLADAARHAESLLVADSCEHMVDEVARLLATLLPGARLQVLATSREPLGVPGETVYQVEPLPLPARPHTTAAEVGRAEAVRLFLDRASQASPGFALTDDNAAAVAELCRRLDGLPLALELAAARVRVFTPQQLVGYLDRRFDLLTGSDRTAAPRHRTLAATIRWSCETLDPRERVLFTRLGVFAASFDGDAVEAVCAGPPLDAGVIAVFSRLVDKSMVSGHHGDPDQVRYRLLESLRMYAGAELTDAAAAALSAAHAAHYLALAEAIAPQLLGPSPQAARARLAVEEPNLRAALAWSADAGEVDTALRLVAALGRYWDDRGQRREAATWIGRVLAAGEPPATPAAVAALAEASMLLHATDVDQAVALAHTAADLAAGLGGRERAVASSALGWAMAYAGRRQEAREMFEGALAFFTAAEHPAERAAVLQGLVLGTDDLDQALSWAQQAATLWRRVGDLRRQANVLYTMADGALNARTRLDDARAWLEESLALSQAADSEHDRMHALLGLARLRWLRDGPFAAEGLLTETLPALRRLGDQRCTGQVLLMLGELAGRRGDATGGAALLRQSIAAAEPAADRQTLSRARRLLDRRPG